jgi:hypothetical protein
MSEQRPFERGQNSSKYFIQRHGKRLLIHALALVAAGCTAVSLPEANLAPAHQVILFLCTYVGILNLIPHDFTWSGAYILPILAGLVPALTFVVSGTPWQITPVWIGLTAMLCRLIHKQSRLADVAPVLPVTVLALVGFALELAALSPITLPLWFGVFGLAVWLGRRALLALDKYNLLADNPVYKDKTKRQRLTDYSATISNLEAKITETPQHLHPYISSISESARSIIDFMVIKPRNFSDGDLFLARYLEATLHLIDEHILIAADYATQSKQNHKARSACPLNRNLDVLKCLDKAFKDRLNALCVDKKLDSQANLAVLDKLLKMDES